MPSEHDVRQRASICQDCWFWRELSCALAEPEHGMCANRRPVRGRAASARPVVQQQPELVPLASGHARVAAHAHATASPFSESTPEATFSLHAVSATVAADSHAAGAQASDASVVTLPTPARPRESAMQSARAVAAARVPAASVRIAIDDDAGAQQLLDLHGSARSASIAGPDARYEQLIARVRERTAQRLAASAAR